jgi:dolichol kinase
MPYIGYNEIFRKFIHVLSAIIPLFHIYVFKEKIDMILFLSFMLIFCFFIETSRNNLQTNMVFKKYLFFMMRNFEKEGSLTGATWVFVGSLFSIIIVPSPFCIIALFFLSVGDTFAAIIGIKFPFFKIGKKTLSGSIACFIACLGIGLIFNQILDIKILIFGALVASIVELISFNINDNVSIPIVSGCAMYIVSLII